jgi:type IV secretory pathway TrbD component
MSAARSSAQSTAESVHTRRVSRSLNKILTIWGVERRLFFLALAVGAGTFNFFGSLAGAITMFLALYMWARWMTWSDPEVLRILLNSAKFRIRYDPAKPSEVLTLDEARR